MHIVNILLTPLKNRLSHFTWPCTNNFCDSILQLVLTPLRLLSRLQIIHKTLNHGQTVFMPVKEIPIGVITSGEVLLWVIFLCVYPIDIFLEIWEIVGLFVIFVTD